MKNTDVFRACFDNICENYNIPAGLHISEPMRDRIRYDTFIVFIDLHTSNHLGFAEQEILKDTLKVGVKSKKDYRRLRSLIRMRLIDAIHQVRDLTEESLRNLGAKI